MRKKDKQQIVARIKARLLADPTLTNWQLVESLGCSSDVVTAVRKKMGLFNGDRSRTGMVSLEEAQAAIKKMGIGLEPRKAFLRRPRVKQETNS